MQQTPKGLRLQIGVYGSMNAGKSTFINAITAQDVSLISSTPGTTTDPVFKPMELYPIGPVVFVDTAGLDDSGELGEQRVCKSIETISSCDAAVLIFKAGDCRCEVEKHRLLLEKHNVPVLIVQNLEEDEMPVSKDIVSANLRDEKNIQQLKKQLVGFLSGIAKEDLSLTGGFVSKGDLVLLVAPQDLQAPKGRLILPQVQTIRDLLDNGCIATTVTLDQLANALSLMCKPPNLVITDSQIFKEVDNIISKNIPLTSFSLLMARSKGDIKALVDAACVLSTLEESDDVLILESCSHHPIEGDIARQKLPALIQKFANKHIKFTFHAGTGLPTDISHFKLALHCGGCMLNRAAFISRQRMFQQAGVPLTNFGVAIAYMNGILDRVTIL